MLRMVCGKTRRDSVSNEIIREMINVEILERGDVAMVWAHGKDG